MTGHTRANDRLWQPDELNLRASEPENARVRALLLEDLAARMEANPRLTWGQARGLFARDWVALALQLGLRPPAAQLRSPLREGETLHERRVDAARTRLRQFMEGHAELGWALVGIESVIMDRRGMALPGGAYATQQRLGV